MPPYVPLIPLDPQLLQINQEGLVTPAAVATKAPADWVPNAKHVRPSSIPTSLALSRATEFVISKGAWTHPLAEASALLLEGLLAGGLTFSWLDPTELLSNDLRSALTVSCGAARFGLLRDRDAKVWGYLVGSPVPVLAGHRQGQLPTLQRLVAADVMARRGEIGTLLAVLKDAFASGWSATLPWMQLVDHLLTRSSTRSPVDLTADVRSLGPFELESLVDLQRQRRTIYLLGLAPGFVTRLARAVAAPETKIGKRSIDLSTNLGEAVARVRVGTADHGEGLATFLTDRLPDGLPEVDAVARSSTLQTSFRAHYQAIQTATGSLSEALYDAPVALSDIARVVARYAPQLVHEAPAAAFSPRYRAYCRRHNLEPYVRAKLLQKLVAAGDAYALVGGGGGTPEGATTAPTSVFIEHLAGAVEERVGELSQFGLALWTIYRNEVGFNSGYRDRDGELLLDPHDATFPLVVSATLDDWWRREANAVAVGSQLATLQRFIWEYAVALPGAPPGSPARLAEAAARAFAKRTLESVGLSYEAVFTCGAGRPSGQAAQIGQPLALAGYGEMQILSDPLRAGAVRPNPTA